MSNHPAAKNPNNAYSQALDNAVAEHSSSTNIVDANENGDHMKVCLNVGEPRPITPVLLRDDIFGECRHHRDRKDKKYACTPYHIEHGVKIETGVDEHSPWFRTVSEPDVFPEEWREVLSNAQGNVSRSLGSDECCYMMFDLDDFLDNTKIDASYICDDEPDGLRRYLKDIVDCWVCLSYPEDAEEGNYCIKHNRSPREKIDSGFRCSNPADEPPMRNAAKIILGDTPREMHDVENKEYTDKRYRPCETCLHVVCPT